MHAYELLLNTILRSKHPISLGTRPRDTRTHIFCLMFLWLHEIEQTYTKISTYNFWTIAIFRLLLSTLEKNFDGATNRTLLLGLHVAVPIGYCADINYSKQS